MANVTDYGLTLTEAAGALLVLAFIRAMYLYARARLRPVPALAPVRASKSLWRRSAPPPAAPEAATAPVPAPAASTPPSGELLPPGGAAAAPAAGDLSISDVVLGTHGAHVEETASGDRLLYWSLTKFRRRKSSDV